MPEIFVLSPKDPSNCCPQPQPSPPKQTPHHVVPASQFHTGGKGKTALLTKMVDGEKVDKYSYSKAPCVCADGVSHSTGKHGDIHTETNNLTVNHPSVSSNLSATGKSIKKDARWSVSESESVGSEAVSKVTKCDKH